MRAAVIGLGLGRCHAEVYDRRPEITSLALCDQDVTTAETLATEMKTPAQSYASIEEAFADGTIDLASVVTPDRFHRAHAEAALTGGAHVLLTKPIATSVEDANAIIASAAQHDRKLMVAHERRFRPSYARTRALVQEGALGDLIYIRLEMLQNAEKKFARAPWYASKEAGRTAITGSGIHQVDLLRWLSGREVLSVRAAGNAIGSIDFHHNKTVVALFELEGGVIGEIVFTYEATPGLGGERALLLGSAGMIRDGVFRSRGSHEEELLNQHAEDMISGSRASVDAFLDALLAETPMPVSGEEALRALQIAKAVDEACMERTPEHSHGSLIR